MQDPTPPATPPRSEAATEDAPQPRRGRWRWMRRLLVTSVITLLLAEGGLRIVLFHPVGPIDDWASGLREASLYAHPRTPLYWELRARLKPANQRKPPLAPHDGLGWISPGQDPVTLSHPEVDQVADRHLVVLYGDSFAKCAGARERCWQHLLDESELGATHAMLNYGVGGYGLDQSVMMLASTIEAHVEAKPLVLLGILVDDDLDRCALRIRGWPKPSFTPKGTDALQAHGASPMDIDEWIAAHPLPQTWWSWRLLVRESGLFTREDKEQLDSIAEMEQSMRTVCARLLRRAKTETEFRGLELVVVLFHGQRLLELEDPTTNWREAFLREHLTREGIPWVSSYTTLHADMRATGRELPQYFLAKGMGRGHYDAEGNEAVFPAILDAVAGRFDGPQGD